MDKYSNKIIKQNSGILSGSIETHECDPKMDCPECHGSGTCQECKGSGDVKCHACNGSGKCQDCHGKGQWRCNECGGSGNCRKCQGTGDIKCSHCHGRGRVPYQSVQGGRGMKDCPKCGGSGYTPCPDCRSGLQSAAKAFDVLTFGAGKTYGHGSGKCSKCGGSGEVICKTCKGSGDCQTCSGSGLLTCKHCNGSGDCPNCDAGKVTCTRCEGSGFYQTYIRRNTTLYSKGWRWAGSTDYKDIIKASYGLTLHEGVVKQWSAATIVESDSIDDTHMKCSKALGEDKALYKEFLDKYSEQTDLYKPNDHFDKPYAKALKIQKIPITKILYQLNGEEYETLIIGNNNIVAAKSIPTVVKGFELSLWEKIKLAFSEKSRLKAYARLGAYIFQCDGISIEEARVLDSMIKALKMKPEQEARFREELRSLNISMPYEKLRKLIKPLFSSKKTISFAWECMAVDKKVSQSEIDLFNNIVSEYKLDSNEIDRLKGLALKFSKLRDEQIAIEYADLSQELSSLRKKLKIGMAITVFVLIAILGICYLLFKPKSLSNSPVAIETAASVENTSEETISDDESEITDRLHEIDQEVNRQMEEIRNDIDNVETSILPIESTDDDFGEVEPIPELSHNVFTGALGNMPVSLDLTFKGYDVSGVITSPLLGDEPYNIVGTIQNTPYEEAWDFNATVDIDNRAFQKLMGILKYTGSDYVIESRFLADDPNRTLIAKTPVSN